IELLVAARALQGVGAAATMAGTLAMLSESAVDDWERSRLVGLWAALGGIALPLGPLLGGLLVDLGSWRAVFWLNLPIIVAALVPIIVHHPRSEEHTSELQSRFDLVCRLLLEKKKRTF